MRTIVGVSASRRKVNQVSSQNQAGSALAANLTARLPQPMMR
jgi:hypothetical protein